ncbi:MAG: hypothetical protein H7196_00650 [candidate division SR1 bacterium]|nr:hypothetical protein [candidate division SR1 bacterium]
MSGSIKKVIVIFTVITSTIVLSTGIFQVNISALENSQPASSSQTYRTWWGNYTYLIKQEAYSLANWFKSKQRDLANTSKCFYVWTSYTYRNYSWSLVNPSRGSCG